MAIAGTVRAQLVPLVLDEPTNNLDLASVAHLTEALESYRGALLVVSHAEPFLAELSLDRTLTVA
ncbi:hypothetical protein [Aeromicrobium duanguangcaii]|uniref:ABC transporter ATP-binding protein n=1 Tax=Aeromicrobium duanguangcaii TaxID=2968086 RepID=A0ABY5KM20_9ACTN|nr:hypothetical protein [Aeromicrobium duanguangcaii]MCD9154415.1 hypothetical protein [Aeromicrobium duanguangcaii]MCL3838162.1 hypothetical protein [Aeromicrobium duanguangcaii]UUI70090.1 hypothetical protein NP095_15150 [Aeromicrobium duanguangcaii]